MVKCFTGTLNYFFVKVVKKYSSCYIEMCFISQPLSFNRTLVGFLGCWLQFFSPPWNGVKVGCSYQLVRASVSPFNIKNGPVVRLLSSFLVNGRLCPLCHSRTNASLVPFFSFLGIQFTNASLVVKFSMFWYLIQLD